jgi:hypothetical protein
MHPPPPKKKAINFCTTLHYISEVSTLVQLPPCKSHLINYIFIYQFTWVLTETLISHLINYIFIYQFTCVLTELNCCYCYEITEFKNDHKQFMNN